jgi:HSP20 family protein
MSNLRLVEPVVNDSLEAMFKRFLAPMRLEPENGSLEMRIDGNRVQIDAEVKQEKETQDKAGKVLRSERYQGAVSRSFSLAQDVDDGKATAKYENGVLTLELPKKTGQSSKRLAIQ